MTEPADAPAATPPAAPLRDREPAAAPDPNPPATPGDGSDAPPETPRPPGAARTRLPGWVHVVAGGFLPGALAGTHLAGLIFFLNPDLSFTAAPLVRGSLVYGALVGAAGLALSLPFLRGRPGRARRWLPWGLTAALVAAALADWAHASAYAFFLPPGINRRLIKAALLLTAAALVAFYTTLLHGLARRRYGARSRWAYAALAALSVLVMVERREAFDPGVPPSPRPSAVEEGTRPTLLVVGLEGATMDAVLPLASQGRLPFLSTMIEGGASGRLGAFPPFRPTALWTTLATGKLPYKHGILGEERWPAPWLGRGAMLEVLPRGLGFTAWGTFGADPVPVGTEERRALALWEVLPRLGTGSAVVGWPGSHPPAAGPVFALSDRYFAGPRTAGAARPPEVAARARLFEVRVDELDPLLLESFGETPPPEAPPALARDAWRESLAAVLPPHHPQAQALFLHLDGLSAVSLAHLDGYAAAQFEGSKRPDAQRSARWIGAYYAHLDLFLSRLWERTPPPKLLAVVSAYGAEPAAGWRRAWHELAPGDPPGAGYAGSPDGVLLLYGEGVRPGALLTGAQLVDVVPTVAYGAGLPIARDLDGRVLTDAFDRAFLAGHPLTFLPSYESLEPAGGDRSEAPAR